MTLYINNNKHYAYRNSTYEDPAAEGERSSKPVFQEINRIAILIILLFYHHLQNIALSVNPAADPRKIRRVIAEDPEWFAGKIV